MNQNKDVLPENCNSIQGTMNITVHGGTEQASAFPEKMFTYNKREYDVEPCTRVNVTFINTDNITHQWMIHGLPESIHDNGMMNIEVNGGQNDTGVFITPSYNETLLVHCGKPQHQQKGMKAQLKVGLGDGNIPNIPGETGSWDRYTYPRENLDYGPVLLLYSVMIGVILTLAILGWLKMDT